MKPQLNSGLPALAKKFSIFVTALFSSSHILAVSDFGVQNFYKLYVIDEGIGKNDYVLFMMMRREMRRDDEKLVN